MTLPGETISTGAPKTCPDCNVTAAFEVMSSAAGHYIGTQCECGLHSRESVYFENPVQARVALIGWALGVMIGARGG